VTKILMLMDIGEVKSITDMGRVTKWISTDIRNVYLATDYYMYRHEFDCTHIYGYPYLIIN